MFFSTNSLTPPIYPRSCPDDQLLSEIHLFVAEVEAVLVNLDPNKACGPDNIPGRLLKSTAAAIAPNLCNLFNMTLSLGVVPAKWKKANITLVHKRDDPSLAANYRPISLLCILSKVLERCVFNRCFSHTSKFLYHLQHGFRPGRSTESQLLVVYHGLLNTVANGKEIDAIYLDLSKPFDKVPHHLLLAKLSIYGISRSLHLWFQSYLSNRYQRVAMEGVTSDWYRSRRGFHIGQSSDRFCSSFSQTIYLITFKQDHL